MSDKEMKFWDLYEPGLALNANGVIGGKRREIIPIACEADIEGQPKIVQAFIRDHDLQEITVSSSCIGFIYTYSKRFKEAKKPEGKPA